MRVAASDSELQFLSYLLPSVVGPGAANRVDYCLGELEVPNEGVASLLVEKEVSRGSSGDGPDTVLGR